MKKFLFPLLAFVLLSTAPIGYGAVEPSELSVELGVTDQTTRTIIYRNEENRSVEITLEVWGDIKPFVSVENATRTVGPFENTAFELLFKGEKAGSFEGVLTVNDEWIPVRLKVEEVVGSLQVMLVSVRDGFEPIPLIEGFLPQRIPPGSNLVYITDTETGDPEDAQVRLEFFMP